MAIRKSDKTYLEALMELIGQFNETTTNLKDSSYPSKCPVDLLKCLIKSSEILTQRVHGIISSSVAGTSPVDDLLSQASDVYDFIDFFQSYVLPIIRSSDSQSVPSELVRPFERMANSIFTNSKLLVSSVPENNYYFSEISPKIKKLFGSLNLDGILKDYEMDSSDVFHLQLSNNPPCNILSHCLLGHEIGHAIYLKNNVEQSISPFIQFDEKVVKRTADSIFQSLMASLSTTTVPSQISLQQTKQSIEYITRIQLPIITTSWAEELFSDFIGTGLFGPAFVCSLAILLLPFEDIDIASESHPPARFRIQSCLTALNRNDPDNPGFGYKGLYKTSKNTEYDCLVKPWREAVGTKFNWPVEEPLKTAYRTISEIKDKIIREAKKQLGDNAYPYTRFAAEVPLLRKRLIDWLPPNEYQIKRGDHFITSSVQAIFNSGWLSYLEDMDGFVKLFPQFDETDIRKKFYQLVTKGVDLGNIQHKWEELSNNI